MCECNCSDRQIEAKLPAPDGGWYLLKRYPGCRYCDSPAGLDIIHVTKSALAESAGGVSQLEMATGLESISTIPTVRTHDVANGVAEAAIAVLSPAGLRRGLVGSFDADEVEFGLSGDEYTKAAIQTFKEYPISAQADPLPELDAEGARVRAAPEHGELARLRLALAAAVAARTERRAPACALAATVRAIVDAHDALRGGRALALAQETPSVRAAEKAPEPTAQPAEPSTAEEYETLTEAPETYEALLNGVDAIDARRKS